MRLNQEKSNDRGVNITKTTPKSLGKAATPSPLKGPGPGLHGIYSESGSPNPIVQVLEANPPRVSAVHRAK
jgi:hypothetical protein